MIKEDKVLNQIINFVNDDENIRAAVLNGSRVNQNAPVDPFQDYDVRLIVKDTTIYKEDQRWIEQFGNLITKQVNPSKGEKSIYGEETDHLIFLMLFKEGFRIDLGFSHISELDNEMDDSLSLVLVDKDELLGELPKPSDKSYYTKKPSSDDFDFVTNEFFWCLTNVAKGLWREELVYSKSMYEMVVRRVFNIMIKWYIGLEHNWKVNSGKFGKWFKSFLSEDDYELVKQSYSGSDFEEFWESLFAASKLFRKYGLMIAKQLGFKYPIEDDENVIQYLNDVREMTKNKSNK